MAQSNDFDMNHPTIISLLYLASMLLGVTAIVGVILAYMWKGEEGAGWEASHYDYHIRTFWMGLAYSIVAIIASILTFGLLGWLFFGVLAIWFIIRGVKALLAAQKHEPLGNVRTWLV